MTDCENIQWLGTKCIEAAKPSIYQLIPVWQHESNLILLHIKAPDSLFSVEYWTLYTQILAVAILFFYG